ncbi:YpjP family protein [Virgibacillus sp. Bac332]|uniref:YpjP family protein n=1 Tax=Virgibacillus sp. Bac332 TaxID=2419842 RepID=UPI000EF48F85|nr:YpjP family protein [Virgibacillus sp. Bac332]
MKQWMRKIAVVLITIMTLGMYVPTSLTADPEEHKERYDSGSVLDEATPVSVLETPEDVVPIQAYTIDQLTEKAKEQALIKMGPRISHRIEDEFTAVILPNIEKVMETILFDDKAPVTYYDISEDPADGYGERIFNIYDLKAQEKVAKFHVRRVHRPLEGHWFNFHYHLQADNFEKHYDIGEIYWDKNTPPKWMT